MQAKIEGQNLVVTIPLQTPTRSKSGKSYIVASTGGFFKTDATVQGQQVSVSLNAIIGSKE